MLATTTKTITFLALATPMYSWDYETRGDNVTHWADLVPECGYSFQSPIDLPFNSLGPCLDPIELEWTSEESHYAIRNTGYSLLAMPFEIDHAGGADISGLEVLHHRNDTTIRLKNAWYESYESNINKEYCFDSLHFHWGKTNDKGSEHTINGEGYPLEVHLVHYSCDYYVAGDALRDYASGKAELKYDDRHVLAVIGVIFEIGDENPVLAQILDDLIIDGIAEKSTPSSSGAQLIELYYTEFDLKGLLPESKEIVGYQGSLTTPPCYETVRWHVLKETMTVSQEQMDAFRMLLASSDNNDSMAPNFRPPQPLNSRTIYNCLEDIPTDGKPEESEEEEEGTVYYVYENGKGTDDTWMVIGIALIALFGIFSCVCCFIIFRLCGWLDDCICMEKYKDLSQKKLPPVPVLDNDDDNDKEELDTRPVNPQPLNVEMGGARFHHI